LRDAKDTAKSALDPVLLPEGQDRIYAANGLEYAAYVNLENAQKNLAAAQEVVDEVEP
jgi:hypothetical protein